jgi:hypothetical protein
MWESRLSGSERGWRTTLARVKYCGTVGKPGGNRENKPDPKGPGSLQPTRKSSFYAPRSV